MIVTLSRVSGHGPGTMGQTTRSWITAQGSRVTDPGQGSGSLVKRS